MDSRWNTSMDGCFIRGGEWYVLITEFIDMQTSLSYEMSETSHQPLPTQQHYRYIQICCTSDRGYLQKETVTSI